MGLTFLIQLIILLAVYMGLHQAQVAGSVASVCVGEVVEVGMGGGGCY